MIMKMPNNSQGGGSGSSHGHGDNYDMDSDEFDSTADIDAGLDDDFSEYLWMENEEEFDKLEMLRLEEEALMEECIEAMLDEEEDNQQEQQANAADHSLLDDENEAALEAIEAMNEPEDIRDVLNTLHGNKTDVAEESNLNPLAEEFVPKPTLIASST